MPADMRRDYEIELIATKALLAATREQLSEYIALFVALRDALPHEQSREIIESVTGAHSE